MSWYHGPVVTLLKVTNRRMIITAVLVNLGKMDMHTEKAGGMLLRHAHVAILNRQYGTEGQLHDSE